MCHWLRLFLHILISFQNAPLLTAVSTRLTFTPECVTAYGCFYTSYFHSIMRHCLRLFLHVLRSLRNSLLLTAVSTHLNFTPECATAYGYFCTSYFPGMRQGLRLFLHVLLSLQNRHCLRLFLHVLLSLQNASLLTVVSTRLTFTPECVTAYGCFYTSYFPSRLRDCLKRLHRPNAVPTIFV
jgi:hypothetical protein